MGAAGRGRHGRLQRCMDGMTVLFAGSAALNQTLLVLAKRLLVGPPLAKQHDGAV